MTSRAWVLRWMPYRSKPPQTAKDLVRFDVPEKSRK
jgi:hypothetical protein